MKKVKRDIDQFDEREWEINWKSSSMAYNTITIALAIDSFIRIIILRQPFSQYWDITGMLFLGVIYHFLWVGKLGGKLLNIKDNPLKMSIVGIVCSMLSASLSYRSLSENRLFITALTFVLTFLALMVFYLIYNRINLKKDKEEIDE